MTSVAFPFTWPRRIPHLASQTELLIAPVSPHLSLHSQLLLLLQWVCHLPVAQAKTWESFLNLFSRTCNLRILPPEHFPDHKNHKPVVSLCWIFSIAFYDDCSVCCSGPLLLGVEIPPRCSSSQDDIFDLSEALAWKVVVLNQVLCTFLDDACTFPPGSDVVETYPGATPWAESQTFPNCHKYRHEVRSAERSNCFSNPYLPFSPQRQPRFPAVGTVSAFRRKCVCCH